MRIKNKVLGLYGGDVLISTELLFGKYETMALLDDGDELDCLCSANEEQARENHKILVDKYVDIRLNGSTYDNLLKIKRTRKEILR